MNEHEHGDEGAGLVACAPTAEDMRQLGAALARVLAPGDTVLLGGDLGAGKTTFTQGLAHALGVTGPVTSPTFVLVHSYRTSAGWDLLHADVWRLEQLQEVIDLALPEWQEEGAAAVVEWGDLAAPALASDCLHVAIAFEPEASTARVAGPQGPGSHGPGPDGPGPGPGPGAGEGRPGMEGQGPGAGEGARRVVFRALGPSWSERMGALEAAVGALRKAGVAR